MYIKIGIGSEKGLKPSNYKNHPGSNVSYNSPVEWNSVCKLYASQQQGWSSRKYLSLSFDLSQILS